MSELREYKSFEELAQALKALQHWSWVIEWCAVDAPISLSESPTWPTWKIWPVPSKVWSEATRASDFDFERRVSLKLPDCTWLSFALPNSLAEGQISRSTHQTPHFADSHLFFESQLGWAANFFCQTFWKVVETKLPQLNLTKKHNRFYELLQILKRALRIAFSLKHFLIRKPSFRRDGAPAFLTEEPNSGTFLQVDSTLHFLWVDSTKKIHFCPCQALYPRCKFRGPLLPLPWVEDLHQGSKYIPCPLKCKRLRWNDRSRNPSSDDWTLARQPSYSRSLSYSTTASLVGFSISYSHCLDQQTHDHKILGIAQWVRRLPCMTSQRPWTFRSLSGNLIKYL